MRWKLLQQVTYGHNVSTSRYMNDGFRTYIDSAVIVEAMVSYEYGLEDGRRSRWLLFLRSCVTLYHTQPSATLSRDCSLLLQPWRGLQESGITILLRPSRLNGSRPSFVHSFCVSCSHLNIPFGSLWSMSGLSIMDDRPCCMVWCSADLQTSILSI